MSLREELEKEAKFYRDLMNYLPPNEAQFEDKVTPKEESSEQKQNFQNQQTNKSQPFNKNQRNPPKQKQKPKRPPVRPGFEGAKIIRKKRDDKTKNKN